MRSAFLAALLGSTAVIAASAVAQTSPPAGSDQPPAATQPAAPATPAPAPPAASAQPAAPAPQPVAQVGPADLCKELLAYAEKKASEPPKPPAGQATAPAPPPAQASAAPAQAQAAPAQQQAATQPLPRADSQASGTQGGGSVGPSRSTNVAGQPAAPPTAPVSTGAAPEPASSPHASGAGGGAPAGQAGQAGPSADFKLAGGVTLQQVRDTAHASERQACRDSAQKLRRAGADMPAALIALAAYEPDAAKRQ